MATTKSDVIIISVPELERAARTALDQSTVRKDLTKNYNFRVPSALRVGTLDELVALSDELNKIDAFVESVAFKLAQYTKDLVEGSEDQDPLTVEGRTVDDYVYNFEWDNAKYNTQLSTREVTNAINKHVSQIEAQMKQKLQAYNKTKSNLQALERKSNGSLLIRSLADIVDKKDFVLDSEFLVTLVVVVPKHASKEWEHTYEGLDEFVVPRSSSRIASDAEYDLWTVTLFRRAVEAFKTAARERKFVVRDFEFNEEQIEAADKERVALQSDIQKKFRVLVNWCRVSFSEAFVCLMHVKALRVFVESVLRYGLPPRFTSVVLRLNNASNAKKVRTVLQSLYGHLDRAGSAKSGEKLVEIPGLGQQEYFPYVSLDFSLSQFMM